MSDIKCDNCGAYSRGATALLFSPPYCMKLANSEEKYDCATVKHHICPSCYNNIIKSFGRKKMCSYAWKLKTSDGVGRIL